MQHSVVIFCRRAASALTAGRPPERKTRLAGAKSSCGLIQREGSEPPLMFAETDVRRIDLDLTKAKRVWYSGVLSSRMGYIELLQ